jgi:hypothetical protein
VTRVLTVFVVGYLGIITPFFRFQPGDDQARPDPRFGITEAFWQTEEAVELGVGWERILFYWREIQPTGPEDWNTLHVLEEWLVEADNQGRTVVGLLKNTAPWASEDGTEAGLPKGLYLSVDDPDNLWANFVRRIAEYYSVRNVHHWIIWNEPEIRSGVYGYEFAGSVADYYQLLKVAYKVMKETDPDAVIHLAGLTWWHDQTFLKRLLSEAAADPEAPESGYFFDVISLHIYFRTETIQTVMNAVNATQQEFGLNKPVWINETNAPPNRDPLWPVNRRNFQVDLEQQAWFIIQAFALGFATGAERISVYKLIDIHLPEGGESYGLIRPDFSRRPAYRAYAQATRHLTGFTDVSLESWPSHYMVSFDKPGTTTHVLWSRTITDTIVTLPSINTRAAVISPDGRESEIFAVDGAFTISLDGARCYGECIIGGPPVIVNMVDVLERQFERFDEKILEGATNRTKSQNVNDYQILDTPTPTVIPTAESTKILHSPTPQVMGTGTPVLDQTTLAFVTPETPVIVEEEQNFSQTNPSKDGKQLSIYNVSGLWFLALAFVLLFCLTLMVKRTRQD